MILKSTKNPPSRYRGAGEAYGLSEKENHKNKNTRDAKRKRKHFCQHQNQRFQMKTENHLPSRRKASHYPNIFPRANVWYTVLSSILALLSETLTFFSGCPLLPMPPWKARCKTRASARTCNLASFSAIHFCEHACASCKRWAPKKLSTIQQWHSQHLYVANLPEWVGYKHFKGTIIIITIVFRAPRWRSLCPKAFPRMPPPMVYVSQYKRRIETYACCTTRLREN